MKLRLANQIPATEIQDQADIRPLDVAGGLQILLAEIRAAFQQIAESIGSVTGPAVADNESPVGSAAQAAGHIVELVLRSLPDDAANAVVWTAALRSAESALAAGLQRAASTVSNWREVPDAVIDTVQQSGVLVLQALSEEMPNPLWLRPEWVGLAPQLQRFSRRRRAARRRLTDPDHWRSSLDE